MGTDKGLLNYHGTPQREHLFHLLQEFCTGVFTSCRKDQNVPEDYNPLIDKFSIPGPMNGIMTAFSHRPDSAWLIVAVDMPYVGKSTLEQLMVNRDRKKLATCFYSPDLKGPEPLLTLWEPAAFSFLRSFTEKGNISPQQFLAEHNVNVIQAHDVKVLANFNSPNDKL